MGAKGLLIIISGPSGVGKGTVRAALIDDPSLNLWYSVSMTTRKMRPGEANGREYWFVDDETFEENLKKGNFLEHAGYVSHRYGTPKDKVEEKRLAGYNVMLEIDVQGAEMVMKNVGPENVVSIFILPPSFEALESRIRGRSTEAEETIQKRLAQAKQEIAKASQYRYTVINDSVEECAKRISEIIRTEIGRAKAD